MSLLKYDGNKSTSLMARDLLTPDEVKQLHYKTIIFPIIGYPIFRDTVIYNKIKCYSSGEIERKIKDMRDLSDTYFTIEQINYNNKKKKDACESQLEEQNLYNDLTDSEKKMFEPLINKFDQILEGIVYEVKIKKDSGMPLIEIIINQKMNNNIWLSLNSIIDKEYFVVENNSNDNQLMVNIHLKSLNKMIDLMNK